MDLVDGRLGGDEGSGVTQVMWQSLLMDSTHLTLPLLMGSASHSFFFFLTIFKKTFIF